MKEAEYLEHIWQDLEKGISKKGHPFKLATLATIVNANELKQRTLVLRAITNQKTLIFYTDFRSNKVSQVLRNSAASLLFYNDEQKLQISLKGKVTIHTKGDLWKEHLSKISKDSEDDYNTLHAPGTTIEEKEELERVSNLNFCLLEFKIFTIDYLQLHKDKDHQRLIFNKTANVWKGDFVVP